MKAIVNTAPNQLELLDYPLPEPASGQVRIRTGACGICATDLEIIHGWDRTGYPTIPGHEWAGIVDAIGPDVASGLLGQHCVAENFWSSGGEVGFEHPGGYGQYFLTEARNIHVLPTDFPLTLAALIEPLAVVTRATKKLRLTENQIALICGDGPIGLLTLMLLRRSGVEQVVMIGGRTGRLSLARDLGAIATFNFVELGSGLLPAIQQQFGADFFHIVETSGTASGVSNSLHLIGRGGQLVLLGSYGTARADFPWNIMIRREIQMMGSNASADAWDEAVRMAVQGELPLSRLITHKFRAIDFQDAFALVHNEREDVVKVVLEW